MSSNLDVWNSERAKEVFLCIAQKPKSPVEISLETNYAKSNISDILRNLEKESLVSKRNDLKRGNGRKPQTVWDIKPESLFQKLVYPKNPFFGKYNFKQVVFKFLPRLLNRYLTIIANNPIHRNSFWIEKQPHFRKKVWYETNKITGERTKGQRDWQSYKENRTIYNKVNLKMISEDFIEYLLRNQNYMKDEEQGEVLTLLYWYHLSLESDYLYDYDFIKSKS